MRAFVVGLGVSVAAWGLCTTSLARAAEEADALFTSGYTALAEGRPGDAIADFEALADHGVVNAGASLNRGLAYADRVRIGAEQPGDLGRAAHGFAEARALASDPALSKDAAKALTLARAEVARRRAHTGDPVELDQGVAPGRALVELAPENAWAVLAMTMSVLFGLALFARSRAKSDRRERVGAAVVSLVAAPLLVAGTILTLAARDERLHLVEGIVVAAAARPADEMGVAIPGALPIPEAAEVEVTGARPGWVRVLRGSQSAWLPSQAVRTIARAP